jgi:hypothetical protein
MNSPNARLRVEQLGTRILPSANAVIGSHTMTADPLAHAANSVVLPAAASNALHGTFHGTLKRFTAIPADVGARFAIQGSGRFGGLGTFDVKGVIHGTGFIAKGHATGLMTFTNGHGAITVRLTGPDQPGFSALPGHFHFAVVAGSGAYKNVHGAGDVAVTLQTHGAATSIQLAFA